MAEEKENSFPVMAQCALVGTEEGVPTEPSLAWLQTTTSHQSWT